MVAFGLGVVSLSMFHIAGFTGDVSFSQLVVARIYQTLGIAFLFIPLTGIAYIGVPADKTDQISAFINLARNIGGSVGISLVTTWLARRTQFHQNVLVDEITPYDHQYNALVQSLTEHFAQVSAGIEAARQQAVATIGRLVSEQAQIMAYLDDFWLLGVAFAALIPLTLLVGSSRLSGTPGGRRPLSGRTATTEGRPDLRHRPRRRLHSGRRDRSRRRRLRIRPCQRPPRRPCSISGSDSCVRRQWFRADPALDRRIAERFGDTLAAATVGGRGPGRRWSMRHADVAARPVLAKRASRHGRGLRSRPLALVRAPGAGRRRPRRRAHTGPEALRLQRCTANRAACAPRRCVLVRRRRARDPLLAKRSHHHVSTPVVPLSAATTPRSAEDEVPKTRRFGRRRAVASLPGTRCTRYVDIGRVNTSSLDDTACRMPIHRHDLTDRQWALIKLGLTWPRRRRLGAAEDNRQFVNAVLWILRTGAPWLSHRGWGLEKHPSTVLPLA